MMLTGFLEIDDKEITFFFDGKVVILSPENTMSRHLPVEAVHYDCIYGVTSTNREVFFIGCDYYRGQCITIQGWIIGTSNTGLIDIRGFDSITFSGNVVDAFFTPGRAFKVEENSDHLLKDFQRVPALITIPFEDYIETFDITVSGERIGVDLSVHVSYMLKQEVRNFGQRYTQLRLKFDELKNICDVPKYYLFMFDFFQFVAFRRNIVFDRIDLWKKNGLNEKYEKIASCHFFMKNEEDQFKENNAKVILYEDVREHISLLMQNIAMRRRNDINDALWIPLDDKSSKEINHSTFLNTALSFEGEYTRVFPDTKCETNALFAEIKNHLLEVIGNEKDLFIQSCNSKTQINKGTSYYNKFIESISYIDATLEEKFNTALKRYKFIKKSADILVKREKSEEIDNFGNIFAGMRNKIGHGNPPSIEREHVVVFRLARMLIYALILEGSGFRMDEIERVLTNLRI